MSLSETRFGTNATGLPGPTPLPSLTSALSRRTALFGAVTVAGCTAAAVVPAAVQAAAIPSRTLTASVAPPISLEAAALLREFHDVAARYNAAGNRLDETIQETARIPEPEALFARGQDFWILGCFPAEQHWTNQRYSYGSDGLIAKLRELPEGDGDRRRTDRRDEIVGAWDRWHAGKKAAADASGETEALDHYRAVGEEHDAFVRRLVHLKTADPDVMKVKAALVLNAWRDVKRFDNAVRRMAEDSEDIEDALSISLMRDLMGQLGAEHQVVA